MDSIAEIIKIVTKRRIKKVELFDESSRNKNSNYFKLFEGIHQGTYKSDEEAAKDLYDCDPSEKKYLILKTRLKQKMLNTLFFVDFDDPDISLQTAEKYENEKLLFSSRVILEYEPENKVALGNIEKILRKAQEMSLYELEATCARIMRKHYCDIGKYKDFERYDELVAAAEEKLRMEQEAQRFIEETKVLYHRSKANKPKVAELSKEYAANVRSFLIQTDSVFLKNAYYTLSVLHHQLTDDFESALKLLDEQEDLVLQKPTFFPKWQIEVLRIQHLLYLLHIKDFKEGRVYFEKYVNSFQEGSENWLSFHEYQMTLELHAQNYNAAGELFNKVISNSTFRLFSDDVKNRWKVFQGFLHYIYKYEKEKGLKDLIQNSKTDFSLKQFIATIPAFDKAYRDININTIACQILFLLEKLEIEDIEKRINEIEQYSRRFLKKDMHFRSECFISFLMTLRDHDFRFFQTRKDTEKLFEEMKETPMEFRGGELGLEIMPYEFLWETCLAKIKDYKYG